jgi:hypothetical protein
MMYDVCLCMCVWGGRGYERERERVCVCVLEGRHYVMCVMRCMDVCMYVCMYGYMYVCMYVCMDGWMYVPIHDQFLITNHPLLTKKKQTAAVRVPSSPHCDPRFWRPSVRVGGSCVCGVDIQLYTYTHVTSPIPTTHTHTSAPLTPTPPPYNHHHHQTPTAPITLRDALAGDVWTSLIRPSLDLVFTALYTLHWLLGERGGAFGRKGDLGIVDPISQTWTYALFLTPLVTGMPLLCVLCICFLCVW